MQTLSAKPWKRNPNRTLGTMDVLARLKADAPAAFDAARVVGVWVWCEFDAKPDAGTRSVLKALGFHWNRDRVAWQHPCGRFMHHSPGDPREKYGSIPAAALDDERTVKAGAA